MEERVRIFPREGLVSLLAESEADRDVVIVTAPSGSGKTTLVRDYLSRSGAFHLWYDFDEPDSDPVVFFNRFLALINSKQPFGFPPFTSSYLSPSALISYTDKLFTKLSAKFRNPYLIFDNLHALRENSPLQRVIELLLRGKFYKRLILISRTPFKFLSDWKLESRVLRLDFSQLMMNYTEAEEFLHYLYPTLTKQEVEEIYLSSGGVIAQLKVGAEIRKGTSSEVELGDYRNLFSDEELRALSKYAYVRTIDTSLVDKEDRVVLLNLLDRLAGKHILVNKQGNSYILHDLLRSFLKSRIPSVFGEAYSEVLYLMAKKLSNLGRTEEAINYLLEAGSYTEAFELLRENFFTLFFSERYLSVVSFLNKLEPYFSDNPWFMCFKGACIKLHSPVEAIELLERAYFDFKREGLREGMVFALANIFNAVQYQGEDFERATRFLDELEKMELNPKNMVDTLLLSYAGILYMLGRGEPEKSVELLKLGIEGLEQGEKFYQLLSYLYIYLAIALNSSGKPLEAEDYYIKAEEIYKKSPENPAANSMYEFFASFHNIFLGRFDTAVKRLERAVDYARSWGLKVQLSHLSYKLLEAYLGKGDLKSANVLISELEGSVASWNTFARGIYYQLLAQKYLMEDNLPQALASSEKSLSLLERLKAHIFYRRTRALNAFIRGLIGNVGEAERTLKEIERDATRDGAVMQRITALIYLAYLSRDTNREDLRRYLNEALELAMERGIRSFYNVYPKLLSDICSLALREKIVEDFVRELITFYRLSPPEDVSIKSHWLWDVKIFTFGGLKVEANGKNLLAGDLGGSKPANLFYALLAMGGVNVQVDKFKEIFWKTTSKEKFLNNLEFNLRRLKKVFTDSGVGGQVIIRRKGLASLNTSSVWCDIIEANALIKLIEECATEERVDEEIENIKAFVKLYRGKLLPECQEDWVKPYRDKFHKVFLNLSERLVLFLSKNKRWEEALKFSNLILGVEPNLEVVKSVREEAIEHAG